MKYVIFDGNSNEIQWVNDDTVSQLPDNSRELTDAEWHSRKSVPTPTNAEILATAKLRAERRIETSRNAAIELPILSNALGATHIYSARAENRNFLNNLITLGNGGKFTCIDNGGVRARLFHSQVQLMTLAGDFESHISAQFDHYEAKLAEIDAATTQAELDAITW